MCIRDRNIVKAIGYLPNEEEIENIEDGTFRKTVKFIIDILNNLS